MVKLLLFGGTGIIGEPTANIALEKGFDVTIVGETPISNSAIKFVHVNDVDSLSNQSWDAIFDIYNFDENHSQKLYSKFKNNCGHFIITSTTLVYDRTKYSFNRIFSDHQKAKIGMQGGYVDHKLQIEDFWSHINDVNWTILRPYHILGSKSYIGCLPPHNRDPQICNYIKSGKLDLCDGGRIPLNIIHPNDIAKVFLRCIGNSATYNKSYNVVNPKEIIARDYFLKLAEILGVELKINNISAENIWRIGDWKLTTLPHLYDLSNLNSDIGYIPNTDLEKSLKDALKNPPFVTEKNQTKIYARMHLLPLIQEHKYFK